MRFRTKALFNDHNEHTSDNHEQKILSNTFFSLLLLTPLISHAEILAMVNYDSIAGQSPRREGIAILDIDPDSPKFGNIINDLPLPPDSLFSQ